MGRVAGLRLVLNPPPPRVPAVVLGEVLKAFGAPENAQRMEEARDNACNDMGKMLQFLLPVATQIQQDVIKAYGFSSDGEGGCGCGAGLPPVPRPVPAALPSRSLCRGPQVRPADQILRGAGPGDRQHVRQAQGHVPAAHDPAAARRRHRRGGRLVKPAAPPAPGVRGAPMKRGCLHMAGGCWPASPAARRGWAREVLIRPESASLCVVVCLCVNKKRLENALSGV